MHVDRVHHLDEKATTHAVRDSLVDLFMLAASELIVVTNPSGFSGVAATIGGLEMPIQRWQCPPVKPTSHNSTQPT
jgi:hypothetical protein